MLFCINKLFTYIFANDTIGPIERPRNIFKEDLSNDAVIYNDIIYNLVQSEIKQVKFVYIVYLLNIRLCSSGLVVKHKIVGYNPSEVKVPPMKAH